MSLRQGEVIHYAYLWHWQAERGETEGRKPRPVCVALPLRKCDKTHLFLLPLTTTAPRDGQIALQVPPLEGRRAGLSAQTPGWLILSECNYDILETSYYLDPTDRPKGRFSEAFTSRIKAELRQLIVAGRLTKVDRAGS